jgi:shikimate kinase
MPPRHPAPTISLIGYRGTGKTTVGRLLAERLGVELTDTDDLIVKRCGMDIAEFFCRAGEPAFRQLESQVVADLSDGKPRVVALGGGAVLSDANRAHIRSWGPVVWLQADPQTLARRLVGDPATTRQRPPLTAYGPQQEIAEVLAERLPLYASTCTHQIDTHGKSAQEIADWIVHQVLEQP